MIVALFVSKIIEKFEMRLHANFTRCGAWLSLEMINFWSRCELRSTVDPGIFRRIHYRDKDTAK